MQHHPSSGEAVSVVVAAYDAAATLGAAVRSALASTLVVECIIVDDASDDTTRDVAARLCEEDQRVELVARAALGGPSAARNTGLERASGPRVCFLDADDQLVEGALEALSAALAADRGAVAALGRFTALDDADDPVDVGAWSHEQLGAVVRRHGRTIESPDGLVPEALVTRLVSPPPGAWLVDAACARAVGGFDRAARRSEDLEFLVRIAEAGRVVAVDVVALRYRRHAAQRSAATTRRRWGRGHTMWLVLRAAPGASLTNRLAAGMAAYQLELWARRRRSPSLAVRAMGVRNIAGAAVVRVAGGVAAILPRRTLAPIPRAGTAAVE